MELIARCKRGNITREIVSRIWFTYSIVNDAQDRLVRLIIINRCISHKFLRWKLDDFQDPFNIIISVIKCIARPGER